MATTTVMLRRNLLRREQQLGAVVYNRQFASKKRKRVKVPLKLTKKDRLRTFQKTSTIDGGAVEKALTNAERNLLWIQQSIRSFWGAENSAAVDGIHRLRRPGTVMDRKWWISSLAIAVAPAVLIALFCEFIVKPDMKEVLARNERRRLEKFGIVGDNNDDDEDNEQELVATEGGEPTLQDVMRRMDKLEKKLAKQKKTQEDAIRRSQQSGIRNRYEDEMRRTHGLRRDSEESEHTSSAMDATIMRLLEGTKGMVETVSKTLREQLQGVDHEPASSQQETESTAASKSLQPPVTPTVTKEPVIVSSDLPTFTAPSENEKPKKSFTLEPKGATKDSSLNEGSSIWQKVSSIFEPGRNGGGGRPTRS